MAKGDLLFIGFETGDKTQVAFSTGGGTNAVSTEQVRSGTYGLKMTNGVSCTIRPMDSVGKISGNFGRTAETFFTFYVRFAGYPSTNSTIFSVDSSGFAAVVTVLCGTAGEITLQGTTTSGTIATLSLDTWYRFDLRATKNATSGLKVNGGSETTVTANNQNIDIVGVYSGTGAGCTTYFDDIVVGTTALGASDDPHVLISKPIGAGNYSSWTDGTGSTYAEVDDLPHDSGSTYIQNTSGTSQASTFDMQTAATVGVVGTVLAVQTQVQVAESSSTTTSGGVRLRSGSTDNDSTATDFGNTTYISIRKHYSVDPQDSAAWTNAKFDALEVGPYKGTDNSSIRCTAVFLHLLEDGVAVGGSTIRRYSLSLTGVG